LSIGIGAACATLLPDHTVPVEEWNWLELPLPTPLDAGEVRLTLEASTFIPRNVMAEMRASWELASVSWRYAIDERSPTC
jgi:hypothetical protein